MRVCASAMRLIARALEMNVATTDPVDRPVTALELADGFSASLCGLGVEPLIFEFLGYVSSRRL